MKIKLGMETVKAIDDGGICFANAATYTTTLHPILSVEVFDSLQTAFFNDDRQKAKNI